MDGRAESSAAGAFRSPLSGSGSRALTCYSFLVVFANDDLIDEAELTFLQKLALEDGRLDDEERAVLSNIFARAARAPLDPAIRSRIERFKSEYGIP